MKKITSIIAIITLSIAFSTTASAQVSATANASATIVTPISIGSPIAMNFGDIAVKGTASGTVTMTTAGAVTPSANITLPTSTSTSAKFTVGGQADYAYSITLPTGNSITLTNPTVDVGNKTMTVTGFNSMTLNTSAIDNTGVLTGSADTISVGAVLNVGVSQLAGIYSNNTDLVVTVNYN